MTRGDHERSRDSLSDATIDRLREVADWPDLEGTRYDVLRPIGRGGMGTVYLVRDRTLDREVALKVLADLGIWSRSQVRLCAEARIMARLEHPGIVPVHDVGTLPDGRLYYVMKRVNGARLDRAAADILRGRGAQGVPELLRIFQRICDAVAFAHAHGVVHRDLKPENVMVGPFGEVLVMDWGIAQALADPDAPERTTSPGDREMNGGELEHRAIVGTSGYMAPEQARGALDAIDGRTDVFALGALLRFLLTHPAVHTIPRPLEAIFAKALAEVSASRYPSVDELSADVARFLDGVPVSAYRERALDRIGRFVTRYRTPILLVLAYLLMRVMLFWLTRR